LFKETIFTKLFGVKFILSLYLPSVPSRRLSYTHYPTPNLCKPRCGQVADGEKGYIILSKSIDPNTKEWTPFFNSS